MNWVNKIDDALAALLRLADAAEQIAEHLNHVSQHARNAGAPASGMQEDLADSYRRGYEAGSAAPATSGEGVTT